MNCVIARCSCGQYYVLQCKSFKLLCVIPDLFFSFKYKPGTTGSTSQGAENPLTLPSLVVRCFGFFSHFFLCFVFLRSHPDIIVKKIIYI